MGDTVLWILSSVLRILSSGQAIGSSGGLKVYGTGEECNAIPKMFYSFCLKGNSVGDKSSVRGRLNYFKILSKIGFG